MEPKRSKRRALTFALATCLLTIPAAVCRADDDDQPASRAVDKSQYTLFNPTPKESMREFNSDSPDLTDGPYTIDAGHLQIETAFVTYTFNEHADVTSRTFSVLPTQFRLGVLNNTELDLIFGPFVYSRVHSQTVTTKSTGIDDTTLRAKINLFGNDQGKIAFGLIPSVQIPTARVANGLGTGHVQGGIAFPISFTLPKDFGLGVMPEIDYLRNADNTGYGTRLFFSASLDHPIYGNLGGYVEFVSVASTHLHQTYQAFMGTGCSYLISENFQIDAGVNFGISEQADDYTITAGFTWRI